MTSPEHRIRTTTAVVRDAIGAPLANHTVTVEQRRHNFGFGNIGFEFVALANGEIGEAAGLDGAAARPLDRASADATVALAELWLDLFNQVTLPFYWRGFEPEPARPDTARLLAAARWFAERGVSAKGHPLVWHTLAPEWLLPLSDRDVEHVLRARVTREARDFAGVIDHWDAINEAVILPRFTAEPNAITRLSQSLGRVEMVRLAFETAREANPHARLVLNDFLLTEEFATLIEDCLAAGIRIDAIGLQTHMHQGFRGEEGLGAILESFARFGLPLQLTETTLVSGDLMPAHIVDLNDFQPASWPSTPQGEDRQADELIRHYRLCTAHPLVESITYWGISDKGAWLGAPAGLVRVDGSPKPAYDALHDLIKREWWLQPTTAITDAEGRVQVSGWAGDYLVTPDAGAGPAVKVSI